MERLTLRVSERDIRHLETLVEAKENPNRSEGVREALQTYIESVAREDEEIKDGIVNLYLDDRIGFSDLERFLGYDEAESIKEKTEG
jgi:Arc/MetJ-type ribon-helix-helix transcriptional regulator